jgi:translation initiation factor 4A
MSKFNSGIKNRGRGGSSFNDSSESFGDNENVRNDFVEDSSASAEASAEATAEENNYDSALFEFSDWDNAEIEHDILKGIYAYGFERPSVIQCKAIRPIAKGKDVLAQAQSGTGKTASFTIGALSVVNVKNNFPQVLILSPTRELTLQTANVVRSLGSSMAGLRVQTLYGGSSIDETIAELKSTPPHIICGCTGRVYDLMRRRQIHGQKIKLLILDEADEMLSDGFQDQVYNIFTLLHKDVQVALFSATLPQNIVALTNRFMRDPVKICVKAEKLSLDGIGQYHVKTENDQVKYAVLKDIYGSVTVSQTIIYCNSVRRVVDLFEALKDEGYPVCCIHSNMDRSERDDSFAKFRTGQCRVLISSDLTARGIDVQQVSTVINFDLPKCVHTYLHRIGRSGRWGRKGVGINFVTRKDMYKLNEIRRHYNVAIDEMPADLNDMFK